MNLCASGCALAIPDARPITTTPESNNRDGDRFTSWASFTFTHVHAVMAASGCTSVAAAL